MSDTDTDIDDVVEANIYVETYAGFQFKFKIPRDDQFGSIKHKIEELYDLKVSQQNLVFLDRILDDDSTLEQENIQDGSTLKLVVNLSSGRAVHMQGVNYMDYFCADVTSYFDGSYVEGKMLLLVVHGGIPTLYSSYEENGQRQIVSVFTGAEPNAESWSKYLLHLACIANRFEVDESMEDLVDWCTRNMERNLMMKRREHYIENIPDIYEDEPTSPDYSGVKCELEKWICGDVLQEEEDTCSRRNCSDVKTMYRCVTLPSEDFGHSRKLPPLSSNPTVSSQRCVSVRHIDDRPKTMPQRKCLVSPCEFPLIVGPKQLITGDSVMPDKKVHSKPPVLLNTLPNIDKDSRAQWSTKECNSTCDVRLPLINKDISRSSNLSEDDVKPITNAKASFSE